MLCFLDLVCALLPVTMKAMGVIASCRLACAAFPRDSPESPGQHAKKMRAQAAELSNVNVRLLILWGGLLVGVLHTGASITNGLSVELGLSLESAGDLNAPNQVIALAMVPFAAVPWSNTDPQKCLISLARDAQ